jgi:hypothetical protein
MDTVDNMDSSVLNCGSRCCGVRPPSATLKKDLEFLHRNFLNIKLGKYTKLFFITHFDLIKQ